MTDRREPVMTGGCQCGAVRYALYAAPTGASICHCRMCQKALGNYFGAFAVGKRKDLAWTRGGPAIFRSSEAVERGFCRDCGTPLTFAYVERGSISVSIGSLDEPARVTPEKQYGIESRLPAFERPAALPGETTEQWLPAAWAGKLTSRQHPDRD
jgi:hypothetical protein